jgi:hypothetical protein
VWEGEEVGVELFDLADGERGRSSVLSGPRESEPNPPEQPPGSDLAAVNF